MDIRVTSEQFGDGEPIPVVCAHPSVGGQNRSPQLSWEGAPPETRSFALACWDEDAPTSVGFCHWVRFDIPASRHSLDAGTAAGRDAGADGFTDWGESRYGGMAPPAGDEPHRYHFTVYALDTASLGADQFTSYAKLRFMIRGHVLASGTLTGRYAVSG